MVFNSVSSPLISSASIAHKLLVIFKPSINPNEFNVEVDVSMLKEEWELMRDFIESVEIYPEKLDNG